MQYSPPPPIESEKSLLTYFNNHWSCQSVSTLWLFYLINFMNNTENLKKIAHYMGYRYYGHNDPLLEQNMIPGWKSHPMATYFYKINKVGYDGIPMRYLCRNHNQLPYDKDWNKLIEVCNKIGIKHIPTDMQECINIVVNLIETNGTETL
jgi:hypothetical protein